MACIIIQAAAALGLAEAPGATLRPQHDGTVGFGADVAQLADDSEIEQTLHLVEDLDEAVVIADLVDEVFLLGQLGQRPALGDVETEWLLAEDVQVRIESGAHHFGVKPRRRRNQYRVELLFREQLAVGRIGLDAGVFRQDVEQIVRAIANRDEIDVRMRIDDGLM